MAGQLGHTRADVRVQQAKEPFHADLLEMSFAAPLAVELREMADPGMTPHGHSGGPGPREQVREDARVMVHVVMGVHVGGGSADEVYETRELPLELGGGGPPVDPGPLPQETHGPGPGPPPPGGRL